MKHLTVRNLPPKLSNALAREVVRRGQSLNETIKQLLESALGLDPETPYDNGLGRFAGTWTQKELEAFERATAVFERVDPEQWR